MGLNGSAAWWEIRARYQRDGQRRVRIVVRALPRDWIGRHVERVVRAELLAEGLEVLGVRAGASHHNAVTGGSCAWTPAPDRRPNGHELPLEEALELRGLVEDDPLPPDTRVEPASQGVGELQAQLEASPQREHVWRRREQRRHCAKGIDLGAALERRDQAAAAAE